MKAAVFSAVGQPLEIRTIADPTPRAQDLVMKVHYCGVCGTDLHSTDNHETAVACGMVLGHEFTGEVVEVGKALKGQWKVGDRLTSLPFIGCGACVPCSLGKPWQCAAKGIIGLDRPGGFAELVAVHANEAVRIPDNVETRTSALVEPLAVGLHAVRRGPSPTGKNILVIGAGPIGLATAMWARFFGARHVIVSDVNPQRAQRAVDAFGATGLIDARQPLSEQFADAAGGPPELIYECVGVPGMIQQCIEVAPFGGSIVVVGFLALPDSVVPALAMVNELNMYFVIAYHRSDFQFTVDMLTAGRISADAMVSHVVGFDAFPGAFEALRKPTDQCKILLQPDKP